MVALCSTSNSMPKSGPHLPYGGAASSAKTLAGENALPSICIQKSRKATRGVSLVDLSNYIDKQGERALKECRQLSGTG